MITRISSANSPMNKIGLQTNKISFGKWDDGKYASSSSSGLSDYEENLLRVTKGKLDLETKKVEKTKKVDKAKKFDKTKKTSAAKPQSTVTKSQLIDKLRQYADDPIMVKIIAQQLENLG